MDAHHNRLKKQAADTRRTDHDRQAARREAREQQEAAFAKAAEEKAAQARAAAAERLAKMRTFVYENTEKAVSALDKATADISVRAHYVDGNKVIDKFEDIKSDVQDLLDACVPEDKPDRKYVTDLAIKSTFIVRDIARSVSEISDEIFTGLLKRREVRVVEFDETLESLVLCRDEDGRAKEIALFGDGFDLEYQPATQVAPGDVVVDRRGIFASRLNRLADEGGRICVTVPITCAARLTLPDTEPPEQCPYLVNLFLRLAHNPMCPFLFFKTMEVTVDLTLLSNALYGNYDGDVATRHARLASTFRNTLPYVNSDIHEHLGDLSENTTLATFLVAQYKLKSESEYHSSMRCLLMASDTDGSSYGAFPFRLWTSL